MAFDALCGSNDHEGILTLELATKKRRQDDDEPQTGVPALGSHS
jgi:hypothetical protein